MSEDRISRRIDSLAALEPGWLDGQGLPPTSQAVACARRVAPGLPEAGIFPRLDGGISLESETVTVIIHPDGRTTRHDEDPLPALAGARAGLVRREKP